jgi:putative FmdB family regulatory protein
MPIYEYKCENSHVFDVMQKLSEDPLASCIECGAPGTQVLHPVSLSFKGSGFYSTDYKDTAPKAEATKNGDSNDKADSSPAKGAEKSSPSTEKAASKQD